MHFHYHHQRFRLVRKLCMPLYSTNICAYNGYWIQKIALPAHIQDSDNKKTMPQCALSCDQRTNWVFQAFAIQFVCSAYWSQKLCCTFFPARTHACASIDIFALYFCLFQFCFIFLNDLYKVSVWTKIITNEMKTKNVRLIHRNQRSTHRFVLYVSIRSVFFSASEFSHW